MLRLFRLLNWSLLLRHILAVTCLVIGARQLLLIRDAKLLEYAERYGPLKGAQKYMSLDGTRSMGEQLADLYMREPLATITAFFAGVALSWLIVAERREWRFLPLLVLLVSWVVNRLGFYDSTVGLFATRGPDQLLHALPTVPRLWVIGLFWMLAGLLLLWSTWPRRRAAVASSQ